MKPHLVIKLAEKVPFVHLPHWSELHKRTGQDMYSFCQPIDAFFRTKNLPVQIAAEYAPQGKIWNEAELTLGLNRIFRIVLLSGSPLKAKELVQLSQVGKGQILEDIRPSFVADSILPSFAVSQSSIQSEEARDRLQLREVHEQFTAGHPQITVAVLDTGVDQSHPELIHSLRPGHDFVDIISGAGQFFGDYLGIDDDAQDTLVGHGTHVAGIIAAKGVQMPVGVAPKCKILPVRVLGSMRQGSKYVGAGLVDNINNGIKWAIDQGAAVINMSLGIQHSGGGLPHEEIIDYAQRKGVTVVAASGNDGTQSLYYPGALPHAISVGATNEQGQIASFSTRGKVTVAAPGTQIYSSYLDGDHAFSTGTSQAAPFVSGQIALLKSYALERGKTLSDKQIKYLLRQTADRNGLAWKTKDAGFGTINILDSLRLLRHKIS